MEERGGERDERERHRVRKGKGREGKDGGA